MWFLAAALLAASPVVHAVRTDHPPRIDGDLSDPAWAAAPPITGFTQHDPDDGKPATQPTIVRVLYDEDAIYVAAEMQDTDRPDTRLARRDANVETDAFAVELDPRHDRRTGARFNVTASGVQADEALFNDVDDDGDWDAVWESETRVTDHGWTAEFRIPYSQLRFPDRPQHVWGINFRRKRLKNQERDFLVNTPKNEQGRVSRFADLVGIEGIHPKRTVELQPYGVVRSDLDYTLDRRDPLNAQRTADASAGLDAKYQVGSDLTLTGTINPDFGQVEVDPAAVNLTQFELFFPEKRPFFTEGANMFSFGQGPANVNFNFSPPRPFYSRRIGRQPQGDLEGEWTTAPTETTILGAVKLTGRTAGGWSLGLLDALTDRERGFALDGNHIQRAEIVEPGTNYFVFRPTKDIGTRARIGFFVTSVRRRLTPYLTGLRRDASLIGTDGYAYFHGRDWLVQWMAAGTRVDGSAQAIANTQNGAAHYYGRPDADYIEFDPNRRSLSGFSGRVMVAKQTGRWRVNMQAETYSPGFEVNDIGFMNRADETATHLVVLHNNPDQTPLFRQRTFWMAKWQHFNYAGDVISNGVGARYSAMFHNYMSARLMVMKGLEHPDDRTTRGGPRILEAPDLFLAGSVETDESKPLVAEIELQRYASQNGTRDQSVSLSVGYQPSNHWKLRISPTLGHAKAAIQYVTAVDDPTATRTFGRRYVFATIDNRQLDIPIRAEWIPTPKLSFQVYLQPLIAAGDYHDFKELERPLSLDWAYYGVTRGSIARQAGTYFVTPGAGAPEFSFGDPNFDFRTLRGSAVVRWEFRPGSALYVAWNENRQDTLPTGDFRFRRDVTGILRAPSADVFMIKIAYWLPI